MIDAIDQKILNILQENSRTSNAEIARRVSMAPSAVLERIRRMEEKGIIKEYSVNINPGSLELGMLAFVLVKVNGPVVDKETAELLAQIPEVQEVHIVTGEDCYLLKIRAANPEALSVLMRTQFASITSINSTKTIIVLETVKESSRLPVNNQFN